jgi:predicted metalloprotease
MRVRHLSRFVCVVPLLTALFAAGCVAAPRGGAGVPAQPAGPRTTGTAPAGTEVVDGTRTVGEFRKDFKGATRLAQAYWRKELTASGVDFEPISEVVAYTEDGEVQCGGQPIGLNNAAYCSDGDFIAYDVNWAFGAFRQIGDAFIFYLLGHEYAHAVQARLGIRKRFTIQQELQADCMAGAYIAGSEEARLLDLEDGDIDEFRNGLLAVGDDPGQPWFAEDSHGTAQQRTKAFTGGYDDSLKACDLA